MLIREVGILFRGYSLVNVKYHETGKNDETDLRSALFIALINLAETAFSSKKLHYLDGKKYTIAFVEDTIISRDGVEPEPIYAYVIFDKEKKVEKRIRSIIKPLLKKAIERFIEFYSGKFLSKVAQFREFKEELNSIFGTTTKNMDQKFSEILKEK
ncbi:MAG: hypothetical protein GF311_06505 [Candidatus Lokiarchaeota archaeon]|nr:hypothetical protein [Candidatus Lokiarchaeota archaeon]